MITAAIFPDNSVAVDFAIVGKVDLLVEWLRDRGRFCEAVKLEMQSSVQHHPGLESLISALGSPFELTGPEDGRAEDIRLNRLGGTATRPLEHLGEANTLVVLQGRAELQGSTWLSDDRDSRDLAGQLGIRTRTSVDVLCELMVEKGHSFHEEAWRIWNEMFDHPRGGCERPTSLAEMRTRAGL